MLRPYESSNNFWLNFILTMKASKIYRLWRNVLENMYLKFVYTFSVFFLFSNRETWTGIVTFLMDAVAHKEWTVFWVKHMYIWNKEIICVNKNEGVILLLTLYILSFMLAYANNFVIFDVMAGGDSDMWRTWSHSLSYCWRSRVYIWFICIWSTWKWK